MSMKQSITKNRQSALIRLLSLVVNEGASDPLAGRMERVLQATWRDCVDNGVGAEAWLVLGAARAA